MNPRQQSVYDRVIASPGRRAWIEHEFVIKNGKWQRNIRRGAHDWNAVRSMLPLRTGSDYVPGGYRHEVKLRLIESQTIKTESFVEETRDYVVTTVERVLVEAID